MFFHILVYLMQELCINGDIKGILKIQYCTTTPGASLSFSERSQFIVATFLADLKLGRPNLSAPNFVVKWLTIKELEQLSPLTLGGPTAVLIKRVHVDKDNVSLCPKEVLESADSFSHHKDKRRESGSIDEKSLSFGVKSLEERMMEQSGYGIYGKWWVFLYAFGM